MSNLLGSALRSVFCALGSGTLEPRAPNTISSRLFASRSVFGLVCASLFMAAPATWGQKPEELVVSASDPDGHGILCRFQNKNILIVDGTPEQMGTAHGRLLREGAKDLTQRVVYGAGIIGTLKKGVWFMDTMAEIERRTGPHLQDRMLRECDALSQAAGMSRREGRYANLFPELFHCSGVAVRGGATADGSVIHARVLDYMTDIGLQRQAVVIVYIPDGLTPWISLSYAGFIGTVTAMNAKGLAIGEMGGRGEGNWDGVPMTFLLRDVMERASSVSEGIELMRNSPRTCEYYYVLSDKLKDMAALACAPGKFEILRPGQQDPRLPPVPDDTVLVSADERAKRLSAKLQESHGRIDVPAMIQIIKRPVAMNSNLHNAIFKPETLEMWVADAGKSTPACDEPYVRVNLAELLRFHETRKAVGK